MNQGAWPFGVVEAAKGGRNFYLNSLDNTCWAYPSKQAIDPKRIAHAKNICWRIMI
jgi:hypothetical protein